MPMNLRMIILGSMLVSSFLGVFVLFLFWLASWPEKSRGSAVANSSEASLAGSPISIGLIPERDVFAQSNRYRVLADYLAERLDRPVKLVMVNTYEGVLEDFADKNIDGAFLGSLVAVLAMDRFDAKVLVKPELPDGVSTYHGVIFTREDSPVRKLQDLPGHSIAMVKTTTAGHMFPGCVMMRLGQLSSHDRPRILWVGTHDDVVEKVISGQADAGAVKNLRLAAFAEAHPEWKFRELAHGNNVPNNALVVRGDLADTLGEELSKVLLEMKNEPAGRVALETLGFQQFVACRGQDYSAVYDMVECIASVWRDIGVPGPPPRRPSGWPKPAPGEKTRCYDVSY